MAPGAPKRFDEAEALDAAMELFWTQGYEATGMSALLDHMGIGRQSLYDTFGDKRSLFLAALARYEDAILGEIRQRLTAPGSPLRGIRRALAFYEEHNTSDLATGCLLVNSFAEFGSTDAEVHAALAETGRRFETAWREAFERAVEAGELRDDAEPRALARSMCALAIGSSVMGRMSMTKATIRDVVRMAHALIDSFTT